MLPLEYYQHSLLMSIHIKYQVIDMPQQGCGDSFDDVLAQSSSSIEVGLHGGRNVEQTRMGHSAQVSAPFLGSAVTISVLHNSATKTVTTSLPPASP